MLVSSATLSFDSPAFEAPRGFIALEGVNGAGKTTLQKNISRYLHSAGRKTLETREPGGSKLGQSLRQLLLHAEDRVSEMAELFMFAADRAEHVSKVIRPALDSGCMVITDRYYYSSLAFQGHGRGLDYSTVEYVNILAIQGLEPDLVLLLDLPPKEGLLRNRGKETREGADSFEKEELRFHENIREGFLKIARQSKTPFIVLDALQSAEQVFELARPALDAWNKACR